LSYAGLGLILAGSAVSAQEIKDVPRERTLISQGWDFYNQVPSPTNFSPYAGVLLHQRNSLHYTVSEFLFYTNYNTGELIPWQAESFTYNDNKTEITIKIRDGVKWADGKPFTAEDVVFTADMLKSVAPDLVLSAAIKEWIAKAEAIDPLTVKLTLTKPGPRFAMDFLVQGTASRFTILPKHVWEGQDPRTFGFYDPAKGWPLGTGPYKLVKSDSGSIIYDRRDDWWAVDAGLVKAMPAVERIVYKPATVEALPQLFTNNEVDIGRSLQIGAFEAGSARNPGLVSWNEQGPVWGVPDGCVFRLAFNTSKPPFDDVELRRALNFAVDRDQIVDIAYEGSVPKAVLPFASYGGLVAYSEKLGNMEQAHAADAVDPARMTELLTKKGYAKGADGSWAKPDGSPLPITIIMMQGNPIGPVIVQQLKSAGFNVVFQALQDAAFNDSVLTGNFEAALNTHCGSFYDPWQTLQHFHSKYALPAGQKPADPRAITRYGNPELDALLNKMEGMIPSVTDETYMGSVRQASEIFLRDLPELVFAEEFHVVTFNTTYWQGYPSAKDPYVAPYPPWEGFAMVIHRLQPTQ
jgi:peptide/nickel transport system substrate-binding protein